MHSNSPAVNHMHDDMSTNAIEFCSCRYPSIIFVTYIATYSAA